MSHEWLQKPQDKKDGVEGARKKLLDTKHLYDSKRLYRKTCATTSRGQRYSNRSGSC